MHDSQAATQTNKDDKTKLTLISASRTTYIHKFITCDTFSSKA